MEVFYVCQFINVLLWLGPLPFRRCHLSIDAEALPRSTVHLVDGQLCVPLFVRVRILLMVLFGKHAVSLFVGMRVCLCVCMGMCICAHRSVRSLARVCVHSAYRHGKPTCLASLRVKKTHALSISHLLSWRVGVKTSSLFAIRTTCFC